MTNPPHPLAGLVAPLVWRETWGGVDDDIPRWIASTGFGDIGFDGAGLGLKSHANARLDWINGKKAEVQHKYERRILAAIPAEAVHALVAWSFQAARETELALAQVDRLLALTTLQHTELEESRSYARALEQELRDRVRLEERRAEARGMREAAGIAKSIADQYVGYMSRIERAILAAADKREQGDMP